MLIYGIGHDIVDNQRIKYLLEKYGNRFLNKILSSTEQQYLLINNNLPNFIAKRFAAKEAFAKACGTGLRTPILMSNITINNDHQGKPYLVFSSNLQHWLVQQHIGKCHLSLSDETNLSSAFVILELENCSKE